MAELNYKKTIKNDDSKAEALIYIEVDAADYLKIWETEAQKYAKKITMPGFRKGNVPLATVKTAKANEISELAFNRMINTITNEVLNDFDKQPVSKVRIELDAHDHEDPNHTHEEKDQSIKFSLSFGYKIEPKIVDLTTIKVDKPETSVSDEEITQSLNMMLDNINSKRVEDKKEELTELNDEAVAELVIPDVKTVEDLNALLKTEIEKQKAYEQDLSYRSMILDKIVTESNLVLPESLLEDNLAVQEDEYKNRITKLGFEYDKYLEDKKINIEELRKEWKDLIVADLSRELILSQYAKENNIEPSEEELDEAIKTANPQLKERYTAEGLRQYMKYVLQNNLAFAKIYEIVSNS